MRTAVDSGVDVAVRDLRESLMQTEDISVRGSGGYILLGRRNRNLPEDHTWSEEPCSSFRDEVDKRMDRIKKVTKKSYKGCEACRWQQLNGGTCKGGKARCGQFVKERA
jgi:hypothetical protein